MKKRLPPLVLNDYERGWVSGLIDGEGDIGLEKCKQPNRTGLGRGFAWVPRVGVSNTHRELLERLQTLLGGSISLCRARRPNQRDWYRLRMSNRVAECVLNAITLVIKERQRVLLLEACKKTAEHARYSTPNDARLEQIYLELKVLNRRGR